MKIIIKLISLITVLILTSCASYTTPGGSVQLSQLSDLSINELMSKEAAASFPANISVARIQASNFSSYRLASFGSGRYSIVTTREVETDSHFKILSQLPMVAGIAPLNRILLPTQLDTLKSLREASARLRADILLLYTFDTSFHVGEQSYAPLNLISLGFLSNKEVTVTTTVSAAFFDVRTEFLYGLAESTVKKSKSASMWGTSDAVDDLRVLAEQAAFEKLIPEIKKTWLRIISEQKNSKKEKF